LVKEIIKGSARDLGRVAIPSADLHQDVALDRKGMEDLGNGQMLVTVEMGTLAGSYIRIGKAILKSGSPGFSSEYRRFRFVAPLSDLATKRTVLVSRDGTETPILLQDESITPAKPPILQDLKAVALDETNSVLTAQVSFPADNQTFPMVLVIGDKVFGYSDAPIDVAESHVSGDRRYQTLKVAVPTAFLMAHPAVTVKPLMVDPRYAATKLLNDPSAEVEHLVLLAQDSKHVRYLLLGRRLENIKVILPSEVALQSVGSGSDDATLRLVEIPIGLAKNHKKIVLQRLDERPFLVSLPAVATPDSKPKELKVEERITVGTDEAVIVGDHVDGITKVLFGKKSLQLEKAEKSAKVKGLRAAGATSTAGTKELTLVAKKGSSKTIPLEVVNSKVETVAR